MLGEDHSPPLSPSSLTYRERLHLNSYDVGCLYGSTRNLSVFDRLTLDARSRSNARSRPSTHWSQSENVLFFSSASDSMRRPDTADSQASGFVTNTSSAVYNKNLTSRSGHLRLPGDANVETMSSEGLARMKKREPLDYFASIRPDTQSSSQTMRMFGTYDTDYDHATRSQCLIPIGCPAARGKWHHPDVTLTVPATRRGSQRNNVMF